MIISFLIGNGFDLNLGLKTQYTDFYPTYLIASQNFPPDSCIRKFCDQIEDNYEKWSDFEWAFSQYANGNHHEIGQIIANFNNLFASYLQEQSQSCKYNVPTAVSEFKKFILTPYNYLERADRLFFEDYFNKHTNEHIHFNLVSFNYTDTLEKLQNPEFRNQFPSRINIGNSNYERIINPVLYLHGSLKEGYIIIGVDSFQQFKNENMQSNKRLGRHCIKSIINAQNGYGDKEEKYKKIVESSNIICAYGIAFGETDRSRWNIVSNWLKNSTSNKLIIFKYNPNFSKLDGMSKGLLLDALDEAKDEYLQKLGFEESAYEKISKQIFVADSSKALKFKITENSEAKEAITV
ncbi:MAG: bacteriophage abortive infection AbiH family protein [Ruminococcus sp.]|nr:bacteriophage abortive infection AbiH family protein [Ruminococcus sp.]